MPNVEGKLKTVSFFFILLYSKEVFINKAIGWILRQYSRTNPEWGIHFVAETLSAPLSEKEALRLVLRGA